MNGRPLPTHRPVTVKDVIGPTYSNGDPAIRLRIAINRAVLALAQRRAARVHAIDDRLTRLERLRRDG